MQSFHGVKTRGGSQTELICGRRTARLLSVNAGTRHISHSKQSQSRNTGLVDAGRLLSLGRGGGRAETALLPSKGGGSENFFSSVSETILVFSLG